MIPQIPNNRPVSESSRIIYDQEGYVDTEASRKPPNVSIFSYVATVANYSHTQVDACKQKSKKILNKQSHVQE